MSPDIPNELVEFEHHETQIPDETFLFLATDGIYEQVNDGVMYEPRLLALLEQCACLPKDSITDLVIRDFQGFLGDNSQGDDVTVLVLSTAYSQEHTLRSSWDSLDTTRQYVRSFYKDHPEIDAIAMAAHELAANAIEHGNQLDPNKRIRIVLSSKAMVVEDEGDGFDWQARTDSRLGLELDQERGRGIAMVEMLVGKLVYNEKGNRVSLLLESSPFW